MNHLTACHRSCCCRLPQMHGVDLHMTNACLGGNFCFSDITEDDSVHCRIPHSSVRNFLIAAGTLTAAVYGVRYVRQYSQRERRKALLTHVSCGDEDTIPR